MHTVLSAGILAGMKTVRHFGSRSYDWSGLSKQKTVIGKAKRSILQFSPHTWDDFDWRLTSSPLRCIQCLFPIVLILLMEVGSPFQVCSCCIGAAAGCFLSCSSGSLVSTLGAWPGIAAHVWMEDMSVSASSSPYALLLNGLSEDTQLF